MKYIVAIGFFICAFYSAKTIAQENIYFDANWNITTKQKAVYYRPLTKSTQEKKWVIDYYITGKKVKEVFYVNGKPDGKFSEYYSSGDLKTTGKYKEGLKDGMWKTYYKNGKIKQKGRFKKGEKVGVWKTYYKNN
ncbi:toxin-antitoxin system YwqK family antitoxin [Polaribacter sp.]|uniref:toxin-antitoxin system YwqK family antitoxin n=1 Tax=Polaribacter sp. TaxID=1920175 RepID=UPI003F6C99CA